MRFLFQADIFVEICLQNGYNQNENMLQTDGGVRRRDGGIMISLYNDGERLEPKGRVLWELEQKCWNMGIAETANNLHEDILKRAEASLKKGDERRDAVCDAATLKAYQQFVYDTFIESIGGLPPMDNPLNAETRKRQVITLPTENGEWSFILESVIFESRPGEHITANLYLPTDAAEKAAAGHPVPGVFIPLGHTDEGKAFDEYQRAAQLMCYAGMAALTMDPLGEGERFEHYEASIDFEPIQGCSGEHDLLDWKGKLVGKSLASFFVHDCLRGIEYLASRPEVDAEKIAITGHSGGGTQTSMLMCAGKDILKAAAPCSYTTDTMTLYRYAKDPDNEMVWPGTVAAGIDFVDIAACMAPKPVMFLTNAYDFFPREGSEATLAKLTELYKRVGAERMPRLLRTETGHSYTEWLAKETATYFSECLAGITPDVSAYRYTRLAPETLNATESGQIMLEFPDNNTVQMALEAELAKYEEERAEANKTEAGRKARRARAEKWLRDTASYGRIPCEPHTRSDYFEGVLAHFIYRPVYWRPSEGFFNNGVLIRDMRRGTEPLPVVIALWEDGTRAIERHSNWIHRQCAAGREVFIIDNSANGSCTVNPLCRSSMNISWSTHFIINTYLIQNGDSVAATRLYQAMTAPAAYNDLPFEAKEFIYYGEGEYARYAKWAALLLGKRVSTVDSYQNYREIVTEKYPDQTHTLDWALPDVLKYLDLDEVDEYLKEDGLLTDSFR